MAFIPTQEQIESLYFLLKELRRERVEIRLIRFVKWTESIKNSEIEILCLEDIDRYYIFYNGTIRTKYKD